jgi:hypothetical protein
MDLGKGYPLHPGPLQVPFDMKGKDSIADKAQRLNYIFGEDLGQVYDVYIADRNQACSDPTLFKGNRSSYRIRDASRKGKKGQAVSIHPGRRDL